MGRAQLSLHLLLERYGMSWKAIEQNMVRNALEERRSRDWGPENQSLYDIVDDLCEGNAKTMRYTANILNSLGINSSWLVSQHFVFCRANDFTYNPRAAIGLRSFLGMLKASPSIIKHQELSLWTRCSLHNLTIWITHNNPSNSTKMKDQKCFSTWHLKPSTFFNLNFVLANLQMRVCIICGMVPPGGSTAVCGMGCMDGWLGVHQEPSPEKFQADSPSNWWDTCWWWSHWFGKSLIILVALTAFSSSSRNEGNVESWTTPPGPLVLYTIGMCGPLCGLPWH